MRSNGERGAAMKNSLANHSVINMVLTVAVVAAAMAAKPADTTTTATATLGQQTSVERDAAGRQNVGGFWIHPNDPDARAYIAYIAAAHNPPPGCTPDATLLAGIGFVESKHGYGNTTKNGVVTPKVHGPRLDGTLKGHLVISDKDGGSFDGDTQWERATGPMQFMFQTWETKKTDGDGDGELNPHDIDDAAASALKLLCAKGRDLINNQTHIKDAISNYNRGASYRKKVLSARDHYRKVWS